MLENLEFFLNDVLIIVNDEASSLQNKLELLVAHYIDMLVEHPTLPVFILNAVNNDPKELITKVAATNKLEHTFMARQWRDMMASQPSAINPMHFLMNIFSLTIFPFVARPLIKLKLGVQDDAFTQMMQERKKLIPEWIKAMLAGSL